VNFDQRANVVPKAAVERVISLAHSARSSQLEVQLGGQAIEQTEKVSTGPRRPWDWAPRSSCC